MKDLTVKGVSSPAGDLPMPQISCVTLDKSVICASVLEMQMLEGATCSCKRHVRRATGKTEVGRGFVLLL